MTSLTPPLGPHDHLLGSPDAAIQLVEYGDFQCPYCARAAEAVEAVRDALGERLLYGFRNFPLAQLHPHAVRAAQAAEAARLQGRYWQMHALLYEHQDQLDDEGLVRCAAEAGCDLERFAADFDSDPVIEKVRTDFVSGTRSGVSGTPTFFINGERYEGSYDPEVLIPLLQELLSSRELR